MLLTVIDSEGVPQTIVVEGQEVVVDRSGTIAVDQESQVLMAENLQRSGWIIQNNSAVEMVVNELGTASSQTSFKIPGYGGIFPPRGFPVTTGAVSVVGEFGAIFTAREW